MNYKDFNDNELLSYVSEDNEDAINLIYEKYKPLINTVATTLHRRYCKNTGLDVSDLVQEGMLGLNSAMNHYKDNKDVLFYTYAKKCIERKIISTVIMANRKKHKILNESVSFEVNLKGNDVSLDNIIKDTNYDPENLVIAKENNEELMEEINKELTNFELQVLQLKMDGFNHKEISEIIDRDYKSVGNAIQRIKMKIRKILKKLEI